MALGRKSIQPMMEGIRHIMEWEVKAIIIMINRCIIETESQRIHKITIITTPTIKTPIVMDNKTWMMATIARGTMEINIKMMSFLIHKGIRSLLKRKPSHKMNLVNKKRIRRLSLSSLNKK